MSAPTTPTSTKDTSDLALISKIMKSASPKSPAPPTIPPKTPQSPQRKAPQPMTSPLKPKREAPAPPEMEDDMPQSSAFVVDVPPHSLSSISPSKLSQTQTTSQPSPPKRAILTRERAATILRKARESIGLGGIISPETDSEDEEEEGEGKYVMSGGLRGDDLSERELSGRPPRKARVSKFTEDFGEEDDTLVENPAVGQKDREEERKIKKKPPYSPRSQKVGKAERPSAEAFGRGAKEKETVCLTRTHKRRTTRTTIGDDGHVVDSESDTEYYESVGPVGGCVVG